MKDRRVIVVGASVDPADAAGVVLPHRVSRTLGETGCLAIRMARASAPVAGTVASHRFGVFTATTPSRREENALARGLGAFPQNGACDLWAAGLKDVEPLVLLKLMSCNLLAALSVQFGATGRGEHLCGGVRTGLQVLRDADVAIQSGEIDRAVVVAFNDDEVSASVAVLHLSAASGSEGVDLEPLLADQEGPPRDLGVVCVRAARALRAKKEKP